MNCVIVDHGFSNLASLKNLITHINYEAAASDQEEDLLKAKKIILPGVGTASSVYKALHEKKLMEALLYKVEKEKTPILGVCVGMQIMTERSDEGNAVGLGWIKGSCKKFIPSVDNKIKVPHMGWSHLEVEKKSALFSGLESDARFYFVHSYYVECLDENDIAATCVYGNKFVAAFEKDNIFGVQFHPEKSHKFGAKIIENFLEHVFMN